MLKAEALHLDQIKATIRQIIKDILPKMEYSDSSLFGKAGSPSLDRVILASEIESRLRLQFSVEEIGSPDFNTLDELALMIRRKTSAQNR